MTEVQTYPTPAITNGVGKEHASVAKIPTRSALHIVDDRTGKYYNLPIRRNAVDVSQLKVIRAPEDENHPEDQNEQGLRAYDPGFSNTAVSESNITFIDGNKGLILYRGYSISDIIRAKKSYVEVAHLLVWGRWPSPEQRTQLSRELSPVTTLPECVSAVIRAFPAKSSIMGMIIAGLSAFQSTQMEAIPAHMGKNLYLGEPAQVDEQIKRFISTFSVVVAASYCHWAGRELGTPRPELSYVENFLVMTGHVDAQTGLPNPHYVSCFERLWILIADHEMTCSTAALLHTASALPDIISCMISAISALYGPLHGGAIEVAYKNLEEIGTVENVPAKIQRVRDGEERLYGFGHRIYRVEDPRYVFIREIMLELHGEVANDPLLTIAFELERVAAEDEYFVKRKLRPNADLYAALCYKAMGFPAEFILPLSMISRMQGFMAHWKEAMASKPRIWRPAQLYTGDMGLKVPV